MGGRTYNIRAEVVVEASRSWHAAAERIADRFRFRSKKRQDKNCSLTDATTVSASYARTPYSVALYIESATIGCAVTPL